MVTLASRDLLESRPHFRNPFITIIRRCLKNLTGIIQNQLKISKQELQISLYKTVQDINQLLTSEKYSCTDYTNVGISSSLILVLIGTIGVLIIRHTLKSVVSRRRISNQIPELPARPTGLMFG